jgi:soluble lytic murein transglycosylase
MAILEANGYPAPMIRLRPLLTGLLLASLLNAAASPALASSDAYRAVRAEFQRAYAQAAVAEETPRRADSDALRDYPLYPYLQAARIRRSLEQSGPDLGAADQRAQTFITYHEGEPIGRDVHRAWLASLASRELWQTYSKHYREQIADAALQCHSYTARIALNTTEGLAEEIRARWLTPKSLPECERPFNWLKERNELSVELIEQRVRLALEDNNYRFAREIAAQLPPQRTGPMLQWAALIEHPQRQIDYLISHPNTDVESDALLAGWTRFTRRDRDAAKAKFNAFVRSRKMNEVDASPYALALALALSWDRRPDALKFFERVQGPQLDDYALEWQTRAAIWAQDWPLTAKSIAAMSDESRRLARWRYWAGRAAERMGDGELARQLFESLLTDDNFYSMMAAARLDRSLAPNPEKLVLDEVQLAQIEQLPEFVRARELLLSDLRPLANVEWSVGLDRLAEDARKQAIHLAARWGWYQQAVTTATQQRVFNDYALLYPRPFDREVRQAAKVAGLPDELIYGVLRQESLYRHDAVSSAGAHGLLQLIPETARRTAKVWKQPRPSTDDLFDPKVNVTLGAAHLRTLHDRFNGQTVVALAGYNAGPNAAARWLPSERIDPDVWIENIPYNETRNYVQRILWHTVVFKWLQTGEPQETHNWLARVGPPDNSGVVGMAAEAE